MKKYVIAFLICIYTTILVPILISDIPDSVSTLLNITLIAAAVLGILCMIALFKSIKEILQTPKQQDELNNLALLLKNRCTACLCLYHADWYRRRHDYGDLPRHDIPTAFNLRHSDNFAVLLVSHYLKLFNCLHLCSLSKRYLLT